MPIIQVSSGNLTELSDTMKQINTQTEKLKELLNKGYDTERQLNLYIYGFKRLDKFLNNTSESFILNENNINNFNNEFRLLEDVFRRRFEEIETPKLRETNRIEKVENDNSNFNRRGFGRGFVRGPMPFPHHGHSFARPKFDIDPSRMTDVPNEAMSFNISKPERGRTSMGPSFGAMGFDRIHINDLHNQFEMPNQFGMPMPPHNMNNVPPGNNNNVLANNVTQEVNNVNNPASGPTSNEQQKESSE